ncbi:hypothetical protein FQZ97_819330 [compost metagenome]
MGTHDAVDVDGGFTQAAQQFGLVFGVLQCLAQGAGHTIALADVLGDGEHPDDLFVDDDRQVGDVHFQQLAVAVAAANFVALAVAAAGGIDVVLDQCQVFLVYQHRHVVSEQLRFAVAG